MAKVKKNCLQCKALLPTIATCDGNCFLCGGSGSVTAKVSRYCALNPFKTSHQQLKNYARFRGHQIPQNSKKKRSMDRENLERMAKKYKDVVYEGVIAHRQFEKMAGTYGCKDPDRPSGGWWPSSDGCVHPDFAFGPATGQSNSTNPNSQNTPNVVKYGELAFEFKQGIEAHAEHVLIELDWKSFHACTLGWEAQDPSYIRLAKLDIHSYLASFLLKLPERDKALSWEDEKLKAWLKKIKTEHQKVRDKQAKPGILGWGFGLGGGKLYMMNRESFADTREAQGVLDALDVAFPITAQFRRDIPEVAHRQKYLTTKFGGIRWLWNVRTWDIKERKWRHGDDWEKAIAYRPAADAFGHKKAVMRRLREKGWDEKFGLCNDIHDSLMFHCKKRYAEECVVEVKREMEAKSNVLIWPNGERFSCDVDVKAGRNWAEMIGDWKSLLVGRVA